MLGVHKQHIICMGYADTGFEKEISFLYGLYKEKDKSKVFPSQCSTRTYGLQVMDAYHYTKWHTHAVYNRENFMTDLYHTISDYYPKKIYTTSKYDTHGDHVGLFYFVMEALTCITEKNNGYKPQVYQGIVHSTAGDDRWPRMDKDDATLSDHDMPYNLEETTSLIWHERISYKIPQTMMGKIKKDCMKYQAMLKYKSQLKEDVKDYLLAFVKRDVIFWKVNLE